MLPLAQWLMRGRGQATGFVLIALATSPLIWPNSILAAAAIGLVWLRQGAKEGMLIGLWALLPAAMLVGYFGSFMPLLTISTVSLNCLILRVTRSWPYTLAALVVGGFATALILDFVFGNHLTTYTDAYAKMMTEIDKEQLDPALKALLPKTVETSFIAGLFGTMLCISSFVSTALARSWQAKLFNPGGFQSEFHQIRLGKVETIIAVLLLLGFYQLGLQYMTWVWIALFPLLVAGIALGHAFAKQRQLTTPWYVIFYCVLLFWDPLKILLVILAMADSFINFRGRWIKS